MTIILQKSGIVKYYKDFSLGRNWALTRMRFMLISRQKADLSFVRGENRMTADTAARKDEKACEGLDSLSAPLSIRCLSVTTEGGKCRAIA